MGCHSQWSPDSTPVVVDLFTISQGYHHISSVFSKQRASTLPPYHPYNCAIDLFPNAALPSSLLYSLSRPEWEAMERYLSESLAASFFCPSSSPAGAGFFFVKKKDGSLRPCMDYQGLNNIPSKNRYFLPFLDSAFAPLYRARIFTKLDPRNAYHLVWIQQGNKWKTAFNTPLRHFEYLVMPFQHEQRPHSISVAS